MKKTLVLCFIHGFKGGETTFGEGYRFTEHLREAVARQLPKVEVRVLVYPKYETRGDLGQFRSWLEKVIDMEVAAGTASPTVAPSVRTVLVGHSMGGIVAADTVIGLASEKPVGGSAAAGLSGLLFPYVQGVVALDTPLLGVSAGVVARGAEDRYRSAASAVSQLSGLGAALWGSGSGSGSGTGEAGRGKSGDSGPGPGPGPGSPWARWATVAAVAEASGAAAWAGREHITQGWAWAASHLEFVGCLARPDELEQRVAALVRLGDELGVGFANVYTRLGAVFRPERTFCALPRRRPAGEWREAVNDKAPDEAWAHMNMFEPAENPGYGKLTQDAAALVAKWLRNEWYESSSADEPRAAGGAA